MTNQSFDNLVKQKAAEHEAPVPAGAWEAIVKEKKKKRYPVFWWVTGSVIALVVAGFGIRYIAGNHSDPVNPQKSVAQKINVASKAKENHAASATSVTDADSFNPDKTETEKPVVLLPSENVPENTIAVAKSRQSSVTKIQQSNQTSSVSILASSVTGKDSRLTKSSSLQKKNLHISTHRGQHHTTAANKKNIVSENNPPVLSENDEISLAASSLSLFDADAEQVKNDPISFRGPTMSMRNRHAYPLLIKQWKDISVSRPAIAANMVKPFTPAIKRIQLKPSGWSVDISVIPFQPVQQKHSLLSLSRTTTSDMHLAEYKPEEVTTSLKPALAYGLGVNKRINKHIIIGAGLQYSVIKEHITLSGKETNTAYQVVQRLDNTGPAPVLVNDTVASITTGTRTITAINSYRFLEIPLVVQYTLIEKSSWSLRLNGGVQLGIAARYNNSISGKLVPQYSSGDHAQNSKAMRLGFFTGVRLTNRLTRKYEVFAAPYLRFSAGSYNTKTIINNKSIHQAGMAWG